jgi:mRNA interferase YafQ
MRFVLASRFKKDFQKMKRRGKDPEKLHDFLTLLASGKTILGKYRDHALVGNWHSYRSAHIEPDWLIIYKKDQDALLLARTGTHSDLYK